jgi:hypothetical protein
MPCNSEEYVRNNPLHAVSHALPGAATHGSVCILPDTLYNGAAFMRIL